MASDPLLPDLADVPEDHPPTEGDSQETPETKPEHPTGEKQAQENAEREPPA